MQESPGRWRAGFLLPGLWWQSPGDLLQGRDACTCPTHLSFGVWDSSEIFMLNSALSPTRSKPGSLESPFFTLCRGRLSEEPTSEMLLSKWHDKIFHWEPLGKLQTHFKK